MSETTSSPNEQMEAYMAWRSGERVESWNPATKEWAELKSGYFITDSTILRRKPQPKLRKWRPEEVPVGAIVRQKANPKSRTMITAAVEGKVLSGCWAMGDDWHGDWALEKTEYSVDMGKTWLPCGVVE